MQQTPLFEVYADHKAKVVDFHGWALPVQFAGILQEHLHTRTKAGLFDCSHMGEILIQGAQDIAAFDRLVPADMKGLKVGRCRYSAILNEKAGILDDCVGIKLSEDELYLVSNAGPLDEISALVRSVAPGAKNLSDATAKIDLQGPLSREILLTLGLEAIAPLGFWAATRTTWQGEEIIVARAGYTGELGYEIYLPAQLAPALWRAIVAHPEVEPCGLGARDTLRTEMGYPLYGEDITTELSPLEGAMGRFIAWKTEFLGKELLVAQREADNYQVLTPIRSPNRRAPRPGFVVKHEGQEVGRVTSGTFGPSVGFGIGMALLPNKLSAPGIALSAGPKDMPIETASVPIYTEGTCRKKI